MNTNQANWEKAGIVFGAITTVTEVARFIMGAYTDFLFLPLIGVLIIIAGIYVLRTSEKPKVRLTALVILILTSLVLIIVTACKIGGIFKPSQEAKYLVVICKFEGDKSYVTPTIHELKQEVNSLYIEENFLSVSLCNYEINESVKEKFIDSLTQSYKDFNGLIVYGDIYKNGYTHEIEERYYVWLQNLKFVNAERKEALLKFPHSISFSQKCKIEIITKFISGCINLSEGRDSLALASFNEIRVSECVDTITLKALKIIENATNYSQNKKHIGTTTVEQIEQQTLIRIDTSHRTNFAGVDEIDPTVLKIKSDSNSIVSKRKITWEPIDAWRNLPGSLNVSGELDSLLPGYVKFKKGTAYCGPQTKYCCFGGPSFTLPDSGEYEFTFELSCPRNSIGKDFYIVEVVSSTGQVINKLTKLNLGYNNLRFYIYQPNQTLYTLRFSILCIVFNENYYIKDLKLYKKPIRTSFYNSSVEDF